MIIRREYVRKKKKKKMLGIAHSDKTCKSLPRLSVAMEDNPLHETASNVVAVLPASTSSSRGTYVAVAAHLSHQAASPIKDDINSKSGSGGALRMADVFQTHQRSVPPYSRGATAAPEVGGASTAVHAPILQLCLFILNVPQRSQFGSATSLAPDMMLIHTVTLTCEDLRLGPPQQQQFSQSLSPSTTTELEAETKKRKRGPDLSIGVSSNATLSPEAAVVEQVAWVGVHFLAIKTRKRQLLLVRSGLVESVGDSSSDEPSSNAGEGTDSLSSPVCRAFHRVADFCAVTFSRFSSDCVGASALLVAGTQHVSAVVVGDGGGSVDGDAPAQQSLTTRAAVSMREQTWKIGPFSSIRAAATARTASPVEVYFCGTSATHSIEVYGWSPNDAAPPVCVHHVLMTPGHFFYGVSVTVSAAPTESQGNAMDFWVVGAASTDNKEVEGTRSGSGDGATAGLVNETADEGALSRPASLPLLRGLDGNYFQVELSQSKSPGKGVEEAQNAPLPSTEHRTLNSVWQSCSRRHGRSGSGDEMHHFSDPVVVHAGGASSASSAATATTSLDHLESVVSLRIGAPRFLASSSHPSSGSTSSQPSPTHRYLLHLHAVVESGADERQAMERASVHTARHSWRSEVLSLDTAECSAALCWLAEDVDDAAARPPSWKLDPTVISIESPNAGIDASAGASRSVRHELILHTARRVLGLYVERSSSQASMTATASGLYVRGTHALSPSERVIGVRPLQSFTTGPPRPFFLLLFSGQGQTLADHDGAEEQQPHKKLTVYGQAKAKTIWTTVKNVEASLLLSLTPWNDSTVGTRNSSGGGAELMAAVKAMVEAEGTRLQRHFDARMDRLDALLGQLINRQQQG